MFTNFVEWYLENFNYLPIIYTNLESSKEYNNQEGTITGFDSFLEENEQHYEEAEKYKNIQNYPDLEKIFFSKNERLLNNNIDDVVDEVYKDTLSNDITYKDIIKNFIYNLAYKYITTIEIKRDYYNEQKRYIDNLSNKEKEIIKWYTHTGDVIMNSYLRNKLDIEAAYANILEKDMFKKVNYTILKNKDKELLVKEFIEYCITILNNTITNAPKNTRPFIVYQYATDKYLTEQDNYWENIGFYSTTMINDYGVRFFKDVHYKSYIIVPENTSCLIIQSLSNFQSEYEVLFPSNNCFKILKPYTELDSDQTYYLNINPYYERIMIYEKQGSCNIYTYTIEDVFKYPEDELNTFLNSQKIKYSLYNIKEKRYLVVHFLYENNYINLEEYDLEKMSESLKKSNTYLEFLSYL